jgi:tryptophan halogenase
MFLVSSWQYVLYGMEFKTDISAQRGAHARMDEARQEFRNIQIAATQALRDLPDHRALVEKMCREYRQRAGIEPAAA